MTGAYWNNYQIFCVSEDTAVVTTTACQYVATPACPDDSCSELTYTLAEGEFAFINAQGKVLDTTVALPNEFAIAIGGDGFVNKTSIINKKKVKTVNSVCASEAQPKKIKVLFSDIQCDTDYCLSFMINSPMANSWVPGYTVQTSTVKTSCCAGCDTAGSAVELAKLFAKDINTGAFCSGIKNRFIKATAICEGEELTVDVIDNTTCITGDCADTVTTSKTFEAGVIIEGLFYDEYCKCTGVPARRNVRWDGVNFEVKLGAVRSAGDISSCGWSCNYAVLKTQDLKYKTGDGCWLHRDQREAARNYINPVTEEWSTYDFPAQIADLGQLNCECGTTYCTIEIVVDQALSYSNGHEDLHIMLGFPSANDTAYLSFIGVLEKNFDVKGLTCDCSPSDCGPESTQILLQNFSLPTE